MQAAYITAKEPLVCSGKSRKSAQLSNAASFECLMPRGVESFNDCNITKQHHLEISRHPVSNDNSGLMRDWE